MTPNSSDAAGLVAGLRRSGLTLTAEGDQIRVSPKSALTPSIRATLASQQREILRVLIYEDPEIQWRLEVMRPQVLASGPILLLVARDLAPAPGACLSCGDALAAGQTSRCRPCVEAATMALREARSPFGEPGR
jgi:hypothetical protein